MSVGTVFFLLGVLYGACGVASLLNIELDVKSTMVVLVLYGLGFLTSGIALPVGLRRA